MRRELRGEVVEVHARHTKVVTLRWIFGTIEPVCSGRLIGLVLVLGLVPLGLIALSRFRGLVGGILLGDVGKCSLFDSLLVLTFFRH